MLLLVDFQSQYRWINIAVDILLYYFENDLSSVSYPCKSISVMVHAHTTSPQGNVLYTIDRHTIQYAFKYVHVLWCLYDVQALITHILVRRQGGTMKCLKFIWKFLSILENPPRYFIMKFAHLYVRLIGYYACAWSNKGSTFNIDGSVPTIMCLVQLKWTIT